MGITLADLDTVLRGGDFITVHTPLTNETRNLIDEDEFKIMKPGVRIVNCARGGIINEAALAKAVAEGLWPELRLMSLPRSLPPESIAGAGEDHNYPPPGASTAEAQVNVALAVTCRPDPGHRQRGAATNAINMPAISPETLAVMEPFIEAGREDGCIGRAARGNGL